MDIWLISIILNKGILLESNLYNYCYLFKFNSFIIYLYVGSSFMKKKTKKFILEFLDFWPLTIVVPLMLIGIVLSAFLGWGG